MKNTKALLGLPELPSLPDLFELPDLPELPELPNMDELLNPTPFTLDDRNELRYGENNEANAALDDEVIVDEFTAIREGRKKQAEAIELANDTEYWFAVYFQSRDQKEAFLKAVKWFQHGDKYIDGRFAAKKMGIELPPRPAAFKVGKLDQKLKDLT